MNVLITAGRTCTMLDRVRKLDNIFAGRTGTTLALDFYAARHQVTLLTSSPHLVPVHFARLIRVRAYRTFADLRRLMEEEICSGAYDVVIHSGAVGDYEATGRTFEVVGNVDSDDPCVRRLPARGKIPSGHSRLMFEVRPTEKLVDLVRQPWGFNGVLVKFKLQVDNERGDPMSDEELIEIASRSRAHSDADYIVANCLVWARERAIIIGRDGNVEHVLRDGIADALLARVS